MPATSAEAATSPQLMPRPEAAAPRSFIDVVELASQLNEGLLYGHLMTSVHLVRFEVGHIELRLAEHAPSDLPLRLNRLLAEATGSRWMVSVSREAGQPTLREQQQAARLAQLDEITTHPLVQSILQAFPGATIERVREDDTPVAPDPDGDAEA